MENYRKFRNCKLEFPDGVIGIIGPNGAGKSSFIEAISWALYGNEKAIVRTTKEGIRSSAAQPNEECKVLLEFELGGDSYRLERSIRGRDNKVDAVLLVNNALEARGDRDVTEAVIRRLGMDYKAFFISVFARQKDLSALSDLNPAERKKLILRMLDVDVIDKVIKQINEDISNLKKDIDRTNEFLLAPDGRKKREILAQDIKSLELEKERLEEELDISRQKIGGIEESIAQSRQEKDRAAERENQYRKIRERLVNKQAEIDSLVRNIEEVAREINSLREREKTLGDLEKLALQYEDLMAKRDAMEGQLRAFEEKKAVASRIKEIQGEESRTQQAVSKKEEQLATLKHSSESLATVEGSLRDLEEDTTTLKEQVRNLNAEIGRLREEMQEIEHKKEEIGHLGPDSSCPTCERRLGDYHEFLLNKISRNFNEKNQLSAAKEEEKKAKEEESARLKLRREVLEARRKKLKLETEEEIRTISAVESLKERLEALSREKSGANEKLEALQSVEFDERVYNEQRVLIQKLRPQAEKFKELQTELRRIPELESRREKLIASQDSLRIDLEAIESEIRVIGYKAEDLKQTSDRYDSAIHLKEEEMKVIAEKQSGINLREARISDRRSQLDEISGLEKKAAEGRKGLEVLNVLSEVMKQFKASVMSRIVPSLSQVSSQLFTEMTDSRYGGMELDDETYDIRIFDGGEKYPVTRFSGGEGDLANLCLRLAISRVIADRTGSSVNFLILDEIFGSQDQSRKRNIMTTLNQLARQFRQIILITHIDDIKDFMNHVVLIKEREDGTSELVVET